MYNVTVARKTNILGGHVYVVEELDESSHRVCKLPKAEGTPEEYTVDRDLVCSCRAGDFGNDCKHVAMVEGDLEGLSTAKRHAVGLLEGYLDKIREEWPRAQIVSLLPYKPERRVTTATALSFGVLSAESAEKLVIWGEHKGLLIRLYCFKERERYRRALRAARRRNQEDSA
jgi:hypothetical protein